MQEYEQERRRIESPQRTLFLHIGTGKAGSTSLQHSLHLLKCPSIGLLPVRAFGFPNATLLTMATRSAQARSYFVERHKILTLAEFETNADTIWQKARYEIENSGVGRFVASSEFLNTLVRGTSIEILKRKLEMLFDRIEIVVYLRDQNSFLRSLWAQGVKGSSKSVETFSEFLAGLERYRYFWNYSLFIKDWLRVFGPEAMKVTMFDPKALHNGSVIADFFRKAGVDEVPSGANDSLIKNVTPGEDEVEAIRRKNVIARGTGWRPAELAADVRSIEPEQYEKFILEKISEGNQWINTMFFADQPVRLPVA